MKKPVIAAAALLVLAVAGVAIYSRNHHSGKDSITVSGTIEATVVAASFKVPGRISQRPVDEGAAVRAGDIVARLDDTEFRHETASRTAAVDSARAVLAELEHGSLKEEVAQAEAILAATEAEKVRTGDDFSRQEELFRREVIPRQQFDASRAARDAAIARTRQAQEALALVRTGPRSERIDQARARLREAESALALARQRLGDTVLAAPTGGVVLSKHAEPGEQVSIGSPVVSVGDLDNVWLRAYINETDLGRVKTGQRVRLTTDTWPDKAYEGKVSFIASEAEFTPKNVQTQKERVKLVYRIKITLANPKRELKPGMPADAEILIGDEGSGTGNR